jgi:CspA family cold shock protein
MRRRETGTVKWFSDKKGYGFIKRDEAGDIFVHYTEIKGQGFRSLYEGQRVEFSIQRSDKGLRAVNVQPIWYTPSIRAAL